MPMRLLHSQTPSMAVSEFAQKNCHASRGNSGTILTNEQLIELVSENWGNRRPGDGEIAVDRKVLVKVPVEFSIEKWGIPAGTKLFSSQTVLLREDMRLLSFVVKREGQTQEELFAANFITASEAKRIGAAPEPANFVLIVLYSKEALAENDERSSDADWEIITILASAEEGQPMTTLTMARNQLNLPGGTVSVYTAEQYANASVYWSKRVRLIADPPYRLDDRVLLRNGEVCRLMGERPNNEFVAHVLLPEEKWAVISAIDIVEKLEGHHD